MGALTSAVHWWEESQLRVLVLTSLLIQLFLYFFPYFRRRAIASWFRFILWLAYHAGDAVAIYALATLFNRHKADEGDGGGGSGSSNTLLEVFWAPLLLIHLGGSDGVTAYNIEDNELWTRHLLTAVSQVTVAIYVFCKSWPPGGDKRLLQAAIMLFVVGVGKCFFKAWAFKKGSIYSRVSSRVNSVLVSIDGNNSVSVLKDDVNIYYELDEYVQVARDIVVRQRPEDHHQVMEDPEIYQGTVTTTSRSWTQWVVMIKKRAVASIFWLGGLALRRKDEAEAAVQGSSNHPRSRRLRGERQDLAADRGSSNHPRSQRLRGERQEPRNNPTREALFEDRGEVFKLFVDIPSPYPHRISILYNFLVLREDRAYDFFVRGGLASAFLLLYTKLKTSLPDDEGGNKFEAVDVIRVCIQLSRLVLPWASIGLFHHSHREAYNAIDVKPKTEDVQHQGRETAISDQGRKTAISKEVWPQTVAQYSLAGYFVRNKKHNIKMRIVSVLQCKDFLDRHWCMEPCFSSYGITHLVLGYLEDGWKQHIKNPTSYLSFNNHSSKWVLGMDRPRPFDECVLLWHLVTDICFFSTSFPRPFDEEQEEERYQKLRQKSTDCKVVCRRMSNYMVYLLFVNPEMLLPGSRRNLFEKAYDELKDILRDRERHPECWSRSKPCGVKKMKEEEIIMGRVIAAMQQERSYQHKKFIGTAWNLAQRLLEKNEMEMWKEIQDVWVQMLCFSASRCRGYLHAKALGKGDEFLSYVWLLLFHMGMETFSERLQRELLPPTSEVSTTGAGDPSASEVYYVTRAAAGTTASTSEICIEAEDIV